MSALRTVGGSLLVLACVAGCMPSDGSEGAWRTISWSRTDAGADTLPLNADVRYAAGRLAIRGAAAPVLYAADLTWDADADVSPTYSYDSASRTLVVGLERGTLQWPEDDGADGELRLALTRESPTWLQLRLGGTASDVDLTGIRLVDARLATSLSDVSLHFDEPNQATASQLRLENRFGRLRARGLGNANAASIQASSDFGAVDLDFSGRWTRDVTLELDARLSRVVLRVPDDIGVEIQVGGGWGDTPTGWSRTDDRAVSPNWDQARHHLSVRGSTSLARLTVQ